MKRFLICVSVLLSVSAAADRISFFFKPEESGEKKIEHLQSEDTQDMPGLKSGPFHETTPAPNRDSFTENEMASRAKELLEYFSKRLMGYLAGHTYNWVEFDPQLEALRVLFANISQSVKNVSPCKELSQSLKLAEDKLQTIEDTNKSLQGFRDLGLTVYVWNPVSTFSILSKQIAHEADEKVAE